MDREAALRPGILVAGQGPAGRPTLAVMTEAAVMTAEADSLMRAAAEAVLAQERPAPETQAQMVGLLEEREPATPLQDLLSPTQPVGMGILHPGAALAEQTRAMEVTVEM